MNLTEPGSYAPDSTGPEEIALFKAAIALLDDAANYGGYSGIAHRLLDERRSVAFHEYSNRRESDD